MRAPARTRARMSRPSSSRPNGCASDGAGEPERQVLRRPDRTATSAAVPDEACDRSNAPRPQHRCREPDIVHAASYDWRSASARSSRSGCADRARRSARSISRFTDDVRHGDEQDAALHRRIVARADRLNQQTADAGPGEDRFGDDGAGQHRAELQAETVTIGIRLLRNACRKHRARFATRRARAPRARRARAVPRAGWRASCARAWPPAARPA